MSEKSDYVIGIDLGGTKIEVGLVHSSGLIKNHIRLDTKALEGPKVVENQLIEAVNQLKSSENICIEGIGIGVAGQINAQTGVVHFAPNLPGWHNIALQSNLQEALKVPVRIINDVRAITWGEWLYGAGMGSQDVVCVFVGTGIGSGIVSEGRLLKGASNTFGEVGHMTIDFQGPLCTCGNRGCWEAFAGGWGIAQQAKEAIQASNREGMLLMQLANNQIANVTAKTVMQAYRQGDVLAQRIIERVTKALIAGSISLVNAFNPSRFILGGGLIDGSPEFISLVNKGIRKFALKSATDHLQVVPAKLGKEVGVIGAAAMLFASLNG